MLNRCTPAQPAEIWSKKISAKYAVKKSSTAEQADSTFDLVTTFVCITILAVYFGMASRKFYRVSRLRSIVGSFVIAMVFMLSLMAYRMFLFYKIIYSLQ